MNYKIGSYLGKVCFLIVIYSIKKGHGWTWKCVDEFCIRSKEATDSAPGSFQTLDLCRSACGSYGSLWPRPTGLVTLSKETVVINPKLIRCEMDPVKENAPDDFTTLVKGICDNLVEDILKMCGKECAGNVSSSMTVKIAVNNTATRFHWGTDESYSLKVEHKGTKDVLTTASIQANTAYGARHGLQTLSQLMTVVPHLNTPFVTMMKEAFISDAPAYPHRGLLIDTGRSFLSVETIKRTLDGMASCKLNVLHWHATDAQSFPLKLPGVPQMASHGAYSDEKTYSMDDIREIVTHGHKRGVRVIMEIAIPASVGHGWQWGPQGGLGNLTVCMNQMAGWNHCEKPPCGALNLANPNIYKILELIYKDLLQVIQKREVLHLGGEETPVECWNRTGEVINYIGNRYHVKDRDSFTSKWADFDNKVKNVLDTFSGNDNPSILWHNSVSRPESVETFFDNRKFVFQVFTPYSDGAPEKLLSRGYQVIISTIHWLLDTGFLKGETYSTWDVVYDTKILPNNQGVHGGELCMWGELADDSSIDAKLWPRTAAFAERIWSNPSSRNATVLYRLLQQRRRLIQLGIEAETIIPEWCQYNEGMCTQYH